MPELPDVEVFRRYLASTALHKKITNVRVTRGRILEGISARALKSGLKGRSIKDTGRHGKYLFAQLNEDGWLILHFGMSGSLKYLKDLDEMPEHGRFILSFSNGYHLVYISQRLLGKIALEGEKDAYIRKKDLGPDALSLNLSAFREIIDRGRGRIKSTLMNQKLVAGIGNVYSDEILFQAGIHPEASRLGDSEIRKLFRSMKEVLETAIDRKANPAELPRSYIIPHRRKGEKCPYCNDKVEKKKIGGRSSYFCPKCQRKTD